MAADRLMDVETHSSARCNLCGALVAPGQPARWVKDGFDIVSCPSCGLLFRRELPQPADLTEIYALDYFKRPSGERGAQGYFNYVADEDIRRIDARRRLALISQHVATGRLLDVGCASGFFLDEACASGWTVKGVDVAPAMTTLARERFHLDVDTVSFQAADLPHPGLDCVTMWDYLEHSYDPAADVRKAFALLRPGGVLALSTGDAGAPLARISGRRWHLLTPRHHNFFFTRQLLTRMLENAGFGAVQTRYEPRHATLRSLAYKLRTLAPHSRVVRAGGDWVDHRRVGDVSVTVNMFDVITLVARRPTTASPPTRSQPMNTIAHGGEAAAGRAALEPKPRAADTEPKDHCDAEGSLMPGQFDLSLALEVVRRRAWIVIVCLIAGLAGAYAVTHSMPRRYRATATLFVGGHSLRGTQATNVQYATVAQGLVTSYAQLAQTNAIAQAAAGVARLPPNAVIGHISSSASPGVQILKLTGDSRAPATAARIANAAAAALVARVEALTQPRTNQVSAQLVDPATSPSSPASPRTSLNLLLGALAGLVIGLGLATARERLDRRLRTRADAERDLDIPLLGVTPKLSRRNRRADALTRHADPRIAEPYRSVAATLVSITTAAGYRRILISSASSNDGKTTLASHLALALAEDHQPTALIEADLHRPSLYRHFPPCQDRTLREIVNSVNGALPDSTTVCANLKVVCAANVEKPDDLNVRDDQFQHTLDAALSEHANILLDGPPVLGVSDARILARSADAVLLVAHAGTSRTEDVHLAIAAFQRLGLDIAGLVLTSAKTQTRRNISYYG